VAFAGLLLGYPVIYYVPPDLADNCLGSLSLDLMIVQASFSSSASSYSSSSYSSSSLPRKIHSLFQFSWPSCFAEDAKERVARFEERVRWDLERDDRWTDLEFKVQKGISFETVIM